MAHPVQLAPSLALAAPYHTEAVAWPCQWHAHARGPKDHFRSLVLHWQALILLCLRGQPGFCVHGRPMDIPRVWCMCARSNRLSICTPHTWSNVWACLVGLVSRAPQSGKPQLGKQSSVMASTLATAGVYSTSSLYMPHHMTRLDHLHPDLIAWQCFSCRTNVCRKLV